MKIFFGENVKRLRQAQGLTQEQLAQRLNVSFQTISKWERNESWPDISMLPVLAGFFGVKVDELLGVNEAENERKIEEVIDAYDNRCFPMQELLTKLKAAVAEFPLDYRLWMRYMECLLGCAHGLEGSLAVEKKVREIYENIVTNCTDDSIRMWAKRVFSMHLHSLARPLEPGGPLGNPARQIEAEQILGTMPNMKTCREHLSTMIYPRGEKHLRAIQNEIVELVWMFRHALFHHDEFAWNFPCAEETHTHADKAIFGNEIFLQLVASIYPDEDYGMHTISVMKAHGYLAFYRAILGDFDAAFNNLHRSIVLARAFEAQPQVISHTSPLLAGLSYDKTCDDRGAMQRMRELFNRYPWPEGFREDPRFQQCLNFSQKS